MISCRHPLTMLRKASEIRVDYKDIERLADFVTEDWTCTADINIYIPRDQLIDWNKINIYKNNLNIILAFEDTFSFKNAAEQGYKYFWSYPVTTWYELRGLIDLGVCQVLLDAPLYFQLPRVKRACGDIEIRLVVNRCFNNYMPRKEGVCGTYVRPEDVEIYSEYVDHMEFDTDHLQKEATLWNVYNEGRWPGNLNLLLDYLVENVDNRGLNILPSFEEKVFAKRRINCGQRCQEDSGNCHFCYSVFKLVNAIDKNKDWILAQTENEKESY